MTLTADMFTGLTTGITNNLNVILPVGLTIFGIIVAVKLIPKIIKRFM